ncbi:MAG: M20/M25/M40 family metallo-hydrolase [Bacillota bacterium]
MAPSPIHEQPALLLQHLIRFDTTNPPGNEAACIGYVKGLLDEAGVPCTIFEKVPGRPNLVARIKGRGEAPGLLLQGHVDVVATKEQSWSVDPFAAQIKDGFIWGRGTLDMKAGVAMFLAALMRARAEGLTLPGDVVLAVLADEEAGGDLGARFLTEEHPHLFDGVRYSLGEFGGFTLQVGGRRYYPIQVAEKQICWLRVSLTHPGGHASMPLKGGAMAQMGALLQRLDGQPLPLHITPTFRQMIEGLASAQPFVTATLLRQLLNPALTDRLMGMLKEKGDIFRPLVRNTASPTIIRGGEKINVHPSRIDLDLDCRLLPGFTPEEMIAELRPLVGPDAAFEVVRYDPYPGEIDMGLFGTLASVLKEADPTGTPIPLLLPAVTDGRFFARLGIQHYGFTPMTLPDDFSFNRVIHAADERIPVDAVAFGANAVYQVLQRVR